MDTYAPSTVAGALDEILAAGVATPIAQLGPELPDQQSRVVRGEVTIMWPYSAFRKSFAFVIAEPDVRLRDSNGQIRLQVDGAIAKLVAESGLESGDEILLSVAGADWAANTYEARIPGSCSNWELRYSQRITLQIKSAFSEETRTLDLVNAPSTESEPAPEDLSIEAPPDPEADPTADTTSVTSPVHTTSYGEFESPAFIKRARLSYGSLFEPDHDPFAEDDGGVKGKGRKRARFGRYSTPWRYASRTPSPEPSETGVEDSEAQDAAQIDGSPSSLAAAAAALHYSAPKMADEGYQVIEPNLAPEQPSADLLVVSPPDASYLDNSALDPPAQNTPVSAPETGRVSTDHVEPTYASAFGTSTLFGGFESDKGDYSVPRFQSDIDSIHGGPSIEEQVRFGFHHSPISPLAAHGMEVDPIQPFAHVHNQELATAALGATGFGASETVQDQFHVSPVSHSEQAPQPQILPLWNVSNEQILDPQHADAALPIDPILMATMDADRDDPDTGVLVRTALPTEVDTYGSYNEGRYQNEVEDEMVAENVEATSQSSEESKNPDEAEYERGLANESYDDYDMRNYADVDDDVEGPYETGLSTERGEADEASYYYSDGSDNQGAEDEEGSSDEGDSEEDSEEDSGPEIRRAPQQAGPVVIDLLSDSEDDEDDAPASPSASASASASGPAPPIPSSYPAEPRLDHDSYDFGQDTNLIAQSSHSQNSQPSPSYEVRSDASHGESESEQSEDDAEGEDEELGEFESPVRSVGQPEPESEDAVPPEPVVSSPQHVSPAPPNRDPSQDPETDRSGRNLDEHVEMAVPMMSGALFPTAADEMQASIETPEGAGGEQQLEAQPGFGDMEQPSVVEEDQPEQEAVSELLAHELLDSEQPLAEHSPAIESQKAIADTTTGLTSLETLQTSQTRDPSALDEHDPQQAAQAATTEQASEEGEDAEMAEAQEMELGSSPPAVESVLEKHIQEQVLVEQHSIPEPDRPETPDVASQDQVELVSQTVVSVDIEQVVTSNSDPVDAAPLVEDKELEEAVLDTAEDMEVTVEQVETVHEKEDAADTLPDPNPKLPGFPEIERSRGQSLSSLGSKATHVFATQIPPSDPGYANDDLLTSTQENDIPDTPDDQAGRVEMTEAEAETDKVKVETEHRGEAKEAETPAGLPSKETPGSSRLRFTSQEPVSDDVDMVDAGSHLDSDNAVEDASDGSGDNESAQPAGDIADAAGPNKDDEPKHIPQDNINVVDEDTSASSVLGSTHEDSGEAAAKDGAPAVEGAVSGGDSAVGGIIDGDNSNDTHGEAAANETMEMEEIRVGMQGDVTSTPNVSSSPLQQVQLADGDHSDSDSDSDLSNQSLDAVSSASDDFQDVVEEADAEEPQDAPSTEQRPRIRAARTPRTNNDTKAARSAYKPTPASENDTEESSSDSESEPEQASAARNTRGARKKDMEQAASTKSQDVSHADDDEEEATDGDGEPEKPHIKVAQGTRKTEASDAKTATRPVTRATKTTRAPTKKVAEAKAGKAKPLAPDSGPSVRLAKAAAGVKKKKGFSDQPQEPAAAPNDDPSIRLARSAVGIINKRKQAPEPKKPTAPAPDGDYGVRQASRAVAGSKRKQPSQPAEPQVSTHDADPSYRLARAAGNKRKRVPDQLEVTAPPAKSRITTRSASSSFRRSLSPAVTEDPSLRLAKAAANSPTRRQKSAASSDAPARTEVSNSNSNNNNTNSSNQLKVLIAQRLRDVLPDYQTLIKVPKMVGKTIDLLAVATTAGTEPKRTKARQYCMSFNVTDASINSRVYEVQLYRLHKESLPVVEPGDRVLLRDFSIVALTDRGWGLRSIEKSSYAVFDDAKHADVGDDDDDDDASGGMAQVRGPPVELTAGDHEVAKLMKQWWELLDGAAKDRIDIMNKKLAAGT